MAINVKRLLAESLVELCDEKPLRKVTVAEIVERAGTGRQTFYNHFRDKNDLIYWIFLRTLAGEKKLVQTKGYFAYLVRLHQEAQKIDRFLVQACKMPGQNSLSEAIYQQNYKYYSNYIGEHFGAQSITDEVEFALKYHAAGASHVYIHWVLDGMPGTAEQQARFILACMPQCIRDFLPVRMESWEAGPPPASA